MSFKSHIKLFYGSGGKKFAEKMAQSLGIRLCTCEVITFSEGNTYVKSCETVRGQDVFIVQPIGLRPNDEFVELLFWIDAFKRASAQSVTAIIPYFSYAKADKKDEPHVSIRARVCADCLEVTGVDRVVTMDLHSPQVQGFFRKPVDNLYGMPVLCEYIKTLNLDNLTVVSPDAGFIKTARRFAEHLGSDLVIGDKIRKDHQEKAEILNVIGEVKDRNCVIVDDFSLSGGTLIKMAEALKARGSKKVIAAITHTLLSEKAVILLEDSPIDLLVGLDTIDNPNVAVSNKIKILSAAPLFAETMARIQRKEPLSELFEHITDTVIRSSW